MKIVKYTEARNNLRRVIDDTVNDFESTCIISKNNQVIMMSKNAYEDLIRLANYEIKKV